MLSSAIQSSQKRVEGRNFSIRKNVLEYDDVMNQQREVIYGQRRKVLDGQDLTQVYEKMIAECVDDVTSQFCPHDEAPADWDGNKVARHLFEYFGMLPAIQELNAGAYKGRDDSVDDFKKRLDEEALARYRNREAELGSAELMREAERAVLLRVVDQHWMEHIDAMDDLRNAIGMRSLAQHDPVVEYRREGFEMFEAMNRMISQDAVKLMMRAHFTSQHAPERQGAKTAKAKRMTESKAASQSAMAQRRSAELGAGGTVSGRAPSRAQAQAQAQAEASKVPVKRASGKVGRNDPCPCGSGKKYKNCCGK